RRTPGAKAHAGDVLARCAGRMQRHAPARARDDVARVHRAAHLHFEPLERGVDVADRAAAALFLAEHVPRLDRLTQLELDAGRGDRTEQRKTEFAVRLEPLARERVT